MRDSGRNPATDLTLPPRVPASPRRGGKLARGLARQAAVSGNAFRAAPGGKLLRQQQCLAPVAPEAVVGHASPPGFQHTIHRHRSVAYLAALRQPAAASRLPPFVLKTNTNGFVALLVPRNRHCQKSTSAFSVSQAQDLRRLALRCCHNLLGVVSLLCIFNPLFNMAGAGLIFVHSDGRGGAPSCFKNETRDRRDGEPV